MKVKVRNVNNGTEHSFEREEWEKIKVHPAYKKVFVEIPTLESLPEIQALRQRQKEEAVGETGQPAPVNDDAAKKKSSKTKKLNS